MATELEPSYPAQCPGCLYWTHSSDSTGHRWPKHRSVEYHTYSSNCYLQFNHRTRDHYRDDNGHNQMGSTQYSPYQSNEGPEHIECTPDMDFVIAAVNNYEQDHDCYWQDCKCSGCTKLVEKKINRKLLKSEKKGIKVVNNRHSRIKIGISSNPGPKPRASDTPVSGSTTSTTKGPVRDKVFVCQVCNRGFGRKHVLQIHARTHTGEKPFECRECHKRFSRDDNLKTHMRLHTGEKPFGCTKCQGKFRERHHLKRHKCLNDAKNIDKPIRRMKEEGDALSNDAIDSHPQQSATTSTSTASVKVEPASSHSTSNSKVTSSTNGTGSGVSVSVTSPLRRPRPSALEAVDLVRAQLYGNALVTIGSDLAAAAASAASGIPFPLPGTEQNRILMQELAQVAARNALSSANSTHSKSSSDGSNSASPLSLNMNISSKPGPKPLAADTPGSGSTTSTTTGPGRDKVFVCQVCNRSFGYKNVLQNHERTHTGVKPFECRECHKRFTRIHHLKDHMRLHTGEKPYHCDQCQGMFGRRYYLKHHKCPNDAENIGKPIRGRQSTAYDELVAVSPAVPLRLNSTDETHIPVVTTAATVTSSAAGVAAAATSSSFYHHIPSVPQPTASPIAKLMAITRELSLESGPSKPRQKPRQTMRILTPQHRDFHRELHMEYDIQTQALNQSLSPSLQEPTTLSVIVPCNYARHTSAPASDSEAESIAKEVDDDIKVVDNSYSRLTSSLGNSHRDDSMNGKSESRGCQCLQFPCIKMLENSPNEFGQKAFEPNDKVALVNQQNNQSEFSLNKKIEDEGVLDFILDYCA